MSTDQAWIPTGEKPYKCAYCGKLYENNAKLKRHESLSHISEKPFKCMECGMAFAERHKLKRHLATHSGVKPHQCFLCLMSFSRVDSLRRHQFIMHKEYMQQEGLEQQVMADNAKHETLHDRSQQTATVDNRNPPQIPDNYSQEIGAVIARYRQDLESVSNVGDRDDKDNGTDDHREEGESEGQGKD